ncbi:MAG TPA: S9 family peptidase, partial [Rhodothermales bacterium]|nr:S9 family peptidase [Rhodothermales bacterium]
MRWRLAPLAVLFVLAPAQAQDDPLTYQTPAPQLAALVDAPRTPAVSLSPDGAMMALLARPSVPPVAELAQPELGLAGTRINPRTNGPSRASGFTGVTLRPIEGGTERAVTGFPEDARLRSPSWSPNGAAMAVLVDRDDRIDLYLVDVATGQARLALPHAVNDAAPGSSYTWLPSSD